MDKNNKKKSRKKVVNNSNKVKTNPRKKRKKSSKLQRIFRLIFTSFYATFVALSKGNNKFLTIGMGIIFLIFIYFFTNNNSYQILVNGQHISTIANDVTTEEAFINTTNARLTSEAGTKVLINEDIVFRPVNSLKRNRNTLEQSLRSVSDVLTYKVAGGSFIVNGQELVTVSSVREANQIYQDLINQFVHEGATIINSGFIEDVEIHENYVDYAEVSSMDTALRILTSTTQEIQNYEVKPGDVLGGIASFADMTLDELLELNEGLTLNTPIRPGDNLVISMSVPLLSVFTEEELIVTEVTPYEVERLADNSQHVSYSRVTQSGAQGEIQNTYIIKRINGQEVERELIGTEVISQPINQILVVGTREG